VKYIPQSYPDPESYPKLLKVIDGITYELPMNLTYMEYTPYCEEGYEQNLLVVDIELGENYIWGDEDAVKVKYKYKSHNDEVYTLSLDKLKDIIRQNAILSI
jgi:hypothetical protein